MSAEAHINWEILDHAPLAILMKFYVCQLSKPFRQTKNVRARTCPHVSARVSL